MFKRQYIFMFLPLPFLNLAVDSLFIYLFLVARMLLLFVVGMVIQCAFSLFLCYVVPLIDFLSLLNVLCLIIYQPCNSRWDFLFALVCHINIDIPNLLYDLIIAGNLVFFD